MTIRNVVARGFGPGAAIKFVATRGFSIGAPVVTPPNASLATRGFGQHGTIARLVTRYYGIGSVIPVPPAPAVTGGGGGGPYIRRRDRESGRRYLEELDAIRKAAGRAAVAAAQSRSGAHPLGGVKTAAIEQAVAAAEEVVEAAAEREIVSPEELGEFTRALNAVVRTRKVSASIEAATTALITSKQLLAEIHRRRIEDDLRRFEEDEDEAIALLLLN